MNSPFTREEQGVARSLERIARHMERLTGVLEKVDTKLANLSSEPASPCDPPSPSPHPSESLPCCIGTADLVAEFIDELFDDHEPKWNSSHYVGFIGGDAVVLSYTDHRIMVRYTTGTIDQVRHAAQRIFDEMDRDNPDTEEGWTHKAITVGSEVHLYYVKS